MHILKAIFSLLLLTKAFRMQRFIILLFFMSFILSSCEDSMVLKSEKKMTRDLQGKWQREYLGEPPYSVGGCYSDTVYYYETWTFKDNNWVQTYEFNVPVFCDGGIPDVTNNDGSDTLVLANFKVDARVSRAFLKFQIVARNPNDTTKFVDKWEFVELEDKVLYLATDDPNSNSVLQREFFKIE
jgi:hypothetical protein